MNVKSILYIFLMLIVLSVSLGVVSAGENVTDTTQEVLGIQQDVIVNNEILEAPVQDYNLSTGEGSFTELQNLINSNTNGVINLNKDYSYKDGDPTTGILINKNLVINGNNYTLDGINQARMFNITSSTVLNDINFVNGNITQYRLWSGWTDKYDNVGYGGAINIGINSTTSINNCKFINNYANYAGGAIMTLSNLTINNCDFYNNSAYKHGGSIYSETYYVWNPDGKGSTAYNSLININGSTFENGFSFIGGAIYADDVVLNNTKVINNSASYSSGAIYVFTIDIDNSEFTNNSVSAQYYTSGEWFYTYSGGALNLGSLSSISNSKFTDNFALIGGAIYYRGMMGYPLNITNTTFIRNRAFDTGGAVYGIPVNYKNVIFINNSAYAFGGAIYSGYYGRELVHGANVENGTFINNSALWGGAISTIYITNITGTFSGNSAYRGNNIVYNTTVLNSTFDGVPDEVNIYKLIHPVEYFADVPLLSDNYTLFLGKGDKTSYNYQYSYPMVESLDSWGGKFNDNSYYVISNPKELINITIKLINDQLYYWTNISTASYKDSWIRYYNQVLELTQFHQDKYDELKLNKTREILNDSSFNYDGAIPDHGFFKQINETSFIFIDFEILQSEHRTNSFDKNGLGHYTYWIPAYKVTYRTYDEVYNFTVEKIALNKTVYNGETTSFDILVKNTGLANLTGVFVEEVIPKGLQYQSFKGNGWKKEGNTFSYNNVLGVNETVKFTVNFKTNMSGNFTNVVVAGFNETENKTGNNTTTVYTPGLSVQKIALNRTVYVGNQTVFTIVVTNTGDCDLSDVTVWEEIPDGLSFKSFSGDSWSSLDNVTFSYASVLKPGMSVSFNVTFDTVRSGNFTNVVVAGSNVTGNKTGNNTTTVYTPGLSVQKISLNKIVYLGNETVFTIVVTNIGDCDLSDVTVWEEIPDGLSFKSFSGDSWSSLDNVTFNYNNVLAAGQSVSFNITFIASMPGNWTNVVTAGSNVTENKTGNNNTSVKNPDLKVEKLIQTRYVYIGEEVIFTIGVTNSGNCDLDNVKVSENYPDALLFKSFSGDSWSSLDNVTFNYNKVLKPNQSAQFEIVFNTVKAGNFTNVITVTSNETGNKTTNNTTTVYNPDLKVEKITITQTAVIGNQVRFEILVSNIGDKKLSGVFVEESSYDGLVFDHAEINGYWIESIVASKYRWTLKTDLPAGEKVAFEVVFNTTSLGTFTNVVVAGSNETENKTSENKTDVVEPKLNVEKITKTPIVFVGEQTSFEIVVKNTGIVKLYDVFIEETSYDGLVYDSFLINSEWTHSLVDGKHRWTLNKVLYPNEVVELTVVFNTTEIGTFMNVVTAGSSNTKNKTANNITIVYNETPETPVSNSTKNPDLTIQKIALEKIVIINDKAAFEILVHNTGDTALYGVTVYEDSFEGLTYDSFTDFSGLWTKNSDLSWTYKEVLLAGEYTSFYVTFNTVNPGEFTNFVSVDSNETPKKSSNDSIVVISPSLDVEKITINKTVNVGEQVIFEIVVHNTCDIDLDNVTVVEYQFDGLNYNSFIDYNGLWNYNGDLSWTLNVPLKSGEYLGFFVVFDTTKVGDFVNTVIANSNNVPNKTAQNTTKVVNNTPPAVPEEPTLEEPVTPETPEEVPPTPDVPNVDVPEDLVPETPQNSTTPNENTNADVLPATGNPLVMALIALICLGAAGLRRKD